MAASQPCSAPVQGVREDHDDLTVLNYDETSEDAGGKARWQDCGNQDSKSAAHLHQELHPLSLSSSKQTCFGYQLLDTTQQCHITVDHRSSCCCEFWLSGQLSLWVSPKLQSDFG